MSIAKDPHAGQPVLARGPAPRDARLALILVHGRGASAEDILGLAAELRLPDVACLAPQAAGHTWYPYSFLSPIEQNEPGISSGLGVIGRLIDDLGREGVPPARIGLLGFSQGACLSLEFAARNARRYAGVFGLSGGLIGPPGTPRTYAGLVRRHAGVPRLQRRRHPHSTRTRARIGGGLSPDGCDRRRAHLPADGAHREPRRARGGAGDSGRSALTSSHLWDGYWPPVSIDWLRLGPHPQARSLRSPGLRPVAA